MSTIDVKKGLLGLVIGIGAHGMSFLFGFIAARMVEPSEGGGFEDIAAVALAFIGTEIVIALGVLIAAGVLIARRRRELGAGLLVGWLAGLGGIWLLLRLSGS